MLHDAATLRMTKVLVLDTGLTWGLPGQSYGTMVGPI